MSTNRDTDLLKYLVFKGISVDNTDLAKNIQSDPHQLDGVISAGSLTVDDQVALSDTASQHSVFDNTKSNYVGVIRGVQVIAQGGQNDAAEVLNTLNKLELVATAGGRTVVIPAANCYRMQGTDGGTPAGGSADGGPGPYALPEPLVFDTSKTSNTIHLRSRGSSSVTSNQDIAVIIYGPWADSDHSNPEDIAKGVLTPGGCDCEEGPHGTFVREAQSYGSNLRMS